jgi:hypothetical protein
VTKNIEVDYSGTVAIELLPHFITNRKGHFVHQFDGELFSHYPVIVSETCYMAFDVLRMEHQKTMSITHLS